MSNYILKACDNILVVRIINLIVIVIHCMLLAWSGCLQSPTWNELGHVVAGVSNITLGRFDLYRVNPPLARSVAAIPIVLSGAATDWKQYSNAPFTRTEWRVGSDFFLANGDRALSLLFAARWACIPFSVLGAFVCCIWARQLHGSMASIIVVILWCTCPFILGHASLVTPDVPSAAMAVSTCYAFWCWLKTPTWGKAIISGVALGLAELTKMTLIIFYPLWVLMWFLNRISRRFTLSPQQWALEGSMVFSQIIISVIVINAGYMFDGSFHRLDSYQFESQALTGFSQERPYRSPGNRFVRSWIGVLPVPLPLDYVRGIDAQRADLECERPSYLCGIWNNKGWWYYYVVALVLKLPLGTLMLFAIATCKKFSCDDIMLLMPAFGIMLLVSSQTSFSGHSRYVIPALPLLYIWCSKVGIASIQKASVCSWFLNRLLLAWVIFSSLSVYPHSLSYFNELAGGPLNGPSYLLGSNVDWGQDLLFLKRWLKANPGARPFKLTYHGFIDPRILGFDYSSLSQRAVSSDPLEPTPGWYALSVNCLFGGACGQSRSTCAWFRRLRPVARAGFSIYIYRISSAHPGSGHAIRAHLSPRWSSNLGPP